MRELIRKILNESIVKDQLRQLIDDEDPIIKKRVCFELAKREVICVSQFMNKQSQIRSILYELMRLGIIDNFEYDRSQNNLYAQKAVRAVKMFLNQVIG
jgi:hypothetical protein